MHITVINEDNRSETERGNTESYGRERDRQQKIDEEKETKWVDS